MNRDRADDWTHIRRVASACHATASFVTLSGTVDQCIATVCNEDLRSDHRFGGHEGGRTALLRELGASHGHSHAGAYVDAGFDRQIRVRRSCES